jgi:hypothetical protein
MGCGGEGLGFICGLDEDPGISSVLLNLHRSVWKPPPAEEAVLGRKDCAPTQLLVPASLEAKRTNFHAKKCAETIPLFAAVSRGNF